MSVHEQMQILYTFVYLDPVSYCVRNSSYTYYIKTRKHSFTGTNTAKLSAVLTQNLKHTTQYFILFSKLVTN